MPELRDLRAQMAAEQKASREQLEQQGNLIKSDIFARLKTHAEYVF